MNKLSYKLFLTIFIILSLCLFSIVIIFGYQNYNREKINITQNLFRINNRFDKDTPKLDKVNILTDSPRKFIDALIYTIKLDSNNNILEIISHAEKENTNLNLQEIAKEIINKKEENTTYIGNLYISEYSYKYVQNNYITIIDNQEIKARLISSLKTTLIFLILMEIVIVIISKVLSKWLIKPVMISFKKQKQFIADASHELKTPLAVILASSEVLESNPKEKKWLETIKNEANRMSKLIKSLLDLARLEEDNNILFENVNLSKLIEKSILSFESLAFEKNISLTYKITDDITFNCNKENISELLRIMLDNAICHTAKLDNIMVNLRLENSNIILEVINKGKPIPKGEEEKIFERFYRTDKSRNRNENRYGLGLAIAKCIVTNHKGKIIAFSDNLYTTFRVIFKNIK